jgi:hypothetical protein
MIGQSWAGLYQFYAPAGRTADLPIVNILDIWDMRPNHTITPTRLAQMMAAEESYLAMPAAAALVL